MVYLKATIFCLVFMLSTSLCAYKLGCNPLVLFPVEKMTEILVKDVVIKYETIESSYSSYLNDS
jgi:hypothetical protein